MQPPGGTHRSAVLGPGDGRGGDPEGVAAQSERLLQGDRQVLGLVVVLDLWGNCSNTQRGRGEGGGQVCTAVRVSTCEYESLTVDFEFGLPLHAARLVGRHALVVPAVAGRR